MDVKEAVLDCYSEGAKEVQPTLCCPVDYNQELLKLIPQEIIEKDYGCGDPSRYVQDGDTVLDLGSGGGKICYMAAQKVGKHGQVIGVDMNDDMLKLARQYQPEMAKKLGNDRVRFVKGHIQDLALSIDAVDEYLQSHPITTNEAFEAFQHWQAEFRQNSPLIADNSVDLVVSNCVLNLVSDEEKQQLIQELFRVLKPGGRVAISDIVSDETSPEHLKKDPELWSGCISGAFQEKEFLDAFQQAGFLSIKYDAWDSEPWQTVENIEFRSVTLTAVKGEQSPCMDIGQAVIYKGPYAEITDDEGHIFPRGERMAVCERTFRFLTEGPLKNDFIGIQPNQAIPAKTFCAPAGTTRPAADTKGGIHSGAAKTSSGCC